MERRKSARARENKKLLNRKFDMQNLRICFVHVINSAPKPCETRVIDGRRYVGAKVEVCGAPAAVRT